MEIHLTGKAAGWFSKRHQGPDAHLAACEAKQDALNRQRALHQKNAEERAMRTPAEQLNLLDKMLGKGMGATRERARLNRQVQAAQASN